MPLIDRVKERVEHALTDPELQRFIDEANQEIIDRWGANADPALPITVTLDGDRQVLSLPRPVDSAHPVAITEYVSGHPVGAETATTLAADDWRPWHGGRTLQRLAGGTNARSRWGDRIAITYTPRNDGNQRQEVIIKLVQLAVEYQGVSERTVGDHRQKNADYQTERERLIGSLAPRGGLLLA